VSHVASDLSIDLERFAIAGEFRISRGAKTQAEVLVAEIRRDGLVGRGESVPYARYGETPASLTEQRLQHEEALRHVSDREVLRRALRPGALRNAVDLALWDLEARRTGISSPRAEAVPTARTLSLADPDAMARTALAMPSALLKIKLAGDPRDADRLRAIHAARPDAQLWLDANEGLDVDRYRALVPLLEALPVVLLEQPFAAGADAALAELPRPVPICADESVHDRASLASLADRYDAVNVKLDKTGGLTEALDVVRDARALGLDVVIGCMVCTSLALAPAFVLAADADFVDLDGALFLENDREGGIRTDDQGRVHAPSRSLWAG
jgi:L-alanine-DL-glutamate epimerase-like enolase superfamily enzyme